MTRERHDSRAPVALGLAVILLLLVMAASLWIMTDLDWITAPPLGPMGRCGDTGRLSETTHVASAGDAFVESGANLDARQTLC